MTNRRVGAPRLDREGLAQLIAPQHTAVIVVDVQRLFTDLFPAPVSPPLDEMLANTSRFLEKVRAAGVQVIFVRTIISPEQHSESTLEWGEYMRRNLEPGAPGTEWDPQVEPKPGETQIVKQRYSSFLGTGLEETLRAQDVRTAVVLGLTTDICVGSTVRDAWQRDFRTVTVSDCTSEAGPGRYEAAIATLGRNFGYVFASDELIAAWQPAPTLKAQ
jgi:nicotinamidase-related amidase